MYNIERLYNLVDKLKRESLDRILVSDIKSTLRELSASGLNVPSPKRENLYFVLEHLQQQNEFREPARKVMEKIRRERRSDAESFYIGHKAGDKIGHVNYIDFSQEIYRTTIKAGTSLYQWCKMIYTNDGDVCLYNGEVCTIGDYFSKNKVSPSKSGFGGFYDLLDDKSHYIATGQQVCCRFTFPFSVDCLKSTAKGNVVDTWNVAHYSNGNTIVGNRGIWCNGGAEQLFLPLNESQKKELATKAEFI